MRHDFSRPDEATFHGTPAEMRERALAQATAVLPDGAWLQNDGRARLRGMTSDQTFHPVARCRSCGAEVRHHDVFVTAQTNVFGGGCLTCRGELEVFRFEEE